MNKPFSLQSLRIPAGWTVVYNEFHDVDPSASTVRDWFSESVMFSACNERLGLSVDMNFYPEDDPDGEFVVVFSELPKSLRKSTSPNWAMAQQTHVFRTKSRNEAAEEIERLMSLRSGQHSNGSSSTP
jgi:hypothetical protein